MTEVILICFRLPFEKKVFKILYNANSITYGTDFIIPHVDCLITINLNDYINDISFAELPRTFFDINTARKLLEGKPKGSFNNGREPWKGISVIARSFSDPSLFGKIKAIEDNKYGSFHDWENDLPSEWLRNLYEAIIKEYRLLVYSLQQTEQFDSFINCEMPLLKAFISSSLEGLLFSRELINHKCLELDRIYFESVRELEFKNKYFVNDYHSIDNIDEISHFIPDINTDVFSKKYFWDSIEQYRAISPFLDNLYKERHVKKDLSELLRMSTSISNFCKLQYDIIGTVSGRILITKPGIQYLKRSTRDIFIPSAGKKFIYADYSQFEPGILASLSGDTALITDYNKGDIYTAIKDTIGNNCTRDIAKQLFLSFIYGMSIENIKKNITLRFAKHNDTDIEKFFQKYTKVEEWKKGYQKQRLGNDQLKDYVIILDIS